MRRYTLETIIVILIVFWLLGWLVIRISSGLIHVLLVVILAIIAVRLLQGRKPW